MGTRTETWDEAERHSPFEPAVASKQETMILQLEGISLLQRSLIVNAPLSQKLKNITDAIVRLFDADFCRLWLNRPGDLCEKGCIHAEVQQEQPVCLDRERCLHLLASSGRYTHTDGKGHRRVPFGCHKIGQVASGDKHRCIVNDAANDPCVHDHGWARELGLVSFAGFQLQAPGGKMLGVLALFAKHPIAPAEVAMLDGLSSAVALVVEQAMVDEAPREAHECLEALVDNAGVPTITLNSQFRITRFNRAFESLTGRSARDMIGKSTEALFPPGLSQNSMERIRKTASGLPLDGVEIGIQHLDGSVRTVIWNSATLFGSDGKTPMATIAQGQDITKRKQAEELLCHSEARYRALFQGSADCILIADAETKMLRYANPAACRFLGYSEAELKAMAMGDVHPKDEALRVVAAVEALVHSDDLPLDIPLIPCIRKDGAIVYADVRFVNIAVDGRANLAGFFRDITNRKQADEARAQKTMLLEAHLETSIYGILAVDRAGHAILLNNRFGELWNIPRPVLETKDDAQMLEWVLKQLKHPEEFTQKVAYLYEHTDETCKDEIEFADGRCFFRYSSPLISAEGVYCGRIWYFSDITARKQAEEKLRQTLADLECSNRELEQFAYVASHDMQEPLRMVSSYTQLLARRYQGRLDADADEFIAFAVDGANRMQRLITDLLDYSRVGTRARGYEPTDCTAVLDHALANLKAAIEESGAVVTHDPLPTVMADRMQMVQVLQNLIGNAIKFRVGKSPRIHLSAAQKENEWVFCVRDDGIGIEPQYAERIFNIFQRLHTREEYPGTGIGLAICKKIVERHAGRIWVESQPAKGSAFYFSIPRGGTGL